MLHHSRRRRRDPVACQLAEEPLPRAHGLEHVLEHGQEMLRRLVDATRRRQLRDDRASAGRPDPETSSQSAASGCASSFSSSSRTRSLATSEMRSACDRISAAMASGMCMPSCAARRTPRRLRSGSSASACGPARRSSRRSRSRRPPVGSSTASAAKAPPCSAARGTASALIVEIAQPEVGLDRGRAEPDQVQHQRRRPRQRPRRHARCQSRRPATQTRRHSGRPGRAPAGAPAHQWRCRCPGPDGRSRVSRT